MPPPARRPVVLLALGLLLAGLLSVNVYTTYRVYTSRHPGANDFYSRWVGGQALLRERLNPYSEAVTLRIQQGMYGRPARPDEDQVAFAYPLYSLIVFWPLCFLADYALVQAVWLWLLLVALTGAVVLAMRLVRWRPALWLQLLTITWAVLLYHSFRALILGQLAIVVLLALVAALWALRCGHDAWAGVFLAVSTLKPQLVYLAIPWLLIWAAGQRRWRLWWSAGLSLAALVVGGLILVPSWPADFVRQSLAYPAYTVYGSLTWLVVSHELGWGHAAELAVQVGLACGVALLVWRLRRGTWDEMLWLLGVLLLATNLFTARIATTNYIMLVPWLLWGMQSMERAWGRRGAWLAVTLQLASAAGLWLLFLTTIEGDFETAAVYYPLPAATALLLAWLWTRIDHRPVAAAATRQASTWLRRGRKEAGP